MIAAINRAIGDGRPFPDWRQLCRAALEDPEVLGRVERTCYWTSEGADDPARRRLYARWLRWARAHGE